MGEVWSGVRHDAGRGSGSSPDASGETPETPDTPDVVVVGGGAAGLAATAALRDAGLVVVLVSDGPLGGDCTWHGCVPTKSLLEAAAARLDAAAAVAHARAVVARVARLENEHALARSGVRVLRGRAVLGGDAVVVVTPHGDAPVTSLGGADSRDQGRDLDPGRHPGRDPGPTGGPVPLVLRPSRGVVLATGSRPAPVAGLEPGGSRAGTDPTARPGADGPVVADTDGWLDALQAHLIRLATAPTGAPTTTAPAPHPPTAPDPPTADPPAADPPTAHAPRTAPPRADVVVLGGGGSGVELAQALARLRAAGPTGTVTLLEQADVLLPGTPGAGVPLAAALREDGVDVVTGADPETVRRTAARAGLVLLAAGRAPVLDVLGPDAGVRTADGAVVVDAAMATSAPRVRAAGDLVGLSPSTHVAVATGRVAAAGLLGEPSAPGFDETWVPRVVWTDPQVAAVGRVPGGEGTREVRLPLSRNDRAATAAVPGRPARGRGGVVHVWAGPEPEHGWDRGGRLVGVLMVGPLAGELVAEAALVGRLGLSVQEWVGGRVGLGALAAQHPYPAWGWTWQLVADRLLSR